MSFSQRWASAVQLSTPRLHRALHVSVGNGSAGVRVCKAALDHPREGQLTQEVIVRTVVRLLTEKLHDSRFRRGRLAAHGDILAPVVRALVEASRAGRRVVRKARGQTGRLTLV